MNSLSEAIVLYAEDDENDAFFMRRAFGKAALSETLHIVINGADAISYLSNNKENFLPKFVLLDIKMPIVSGLEVLTWIRETVRNDLPVFMLSSSSQDRDVQEAIQSGANGYLLKPSNAGRLSEALIFIQKYCLERRNIQDDWVQFEGGKLVSISRTALRTERKLRR